jgi:hypothetical protein
MRRADEGAVCVPVGIPVPVPGGSWIVHSLDATTPRGGTSVQGTCHAAEHASPREGYCGAKQFILPGWRTRAS